MFFTTIKSIQLVFKSFCDKVSVVALSGVDTGGLKALVNAYVVPLTDFALWAVPVAAVLIGIVQGITWFVSDEDKKEQKPLARTLKKTAFAAIICECIPALARIFGIA